MFLELAATGTAVAIKFVEQLETAALLAEPNALTFHDHAVEFQVVGADLYNVNWREEE